MFQFFQLLAFTKCFFSTFKQNHNLFFFCWVCLSCCVVGIPNSIISFVFIKLLPKTMSKLIKGKNTLVYFWLFKMLWWIFGKFSFFFKWYSAVVVVAVVEILYVNNNIWPCIVCYAQNICFWWRYFLFAYTIIFTYFIRNSFSFNFSSFIPNQNKIILAGNSSDFFLSNLLFYFWFLCISILFLFVAFYRRNSHELFFTHTHSWTWITPNFDLFFFSVLLLFRFELKLRKRMKNTNKQIDKYGI